MNQKKGILKIYNGEIPFMAMVHLISFDNHEIIVRNNLSRYKGKYAAAK